MARYRTFWQDFLLLLLFLFIYIIKRRWSFVCPSVNQSVYTLTLKQRGLQLQNLVKRYWRRFLRRPPRDFFKNRSGFFRMIFKNIFLDFTILLIFAWLSRSKFGIEILKRDCDKNLKRFFQKSFEIIDRGTSKSKIFVRFTSDVKLYQLSRNLDVFCSK